MEWAQLLEAQQRYHDAELQKWREIIKSSVVLLDQVLRTQRDTFKITSTVMFVMFPNSQRVCLLLYWVVGRHCMCNLMFSQTPPELAS